MRVAALFSGGKDSTFAIYEAKKNNHNVLCLLTIFPPSDESFLLHYPNAEITRLQAQSMEIPQIYLKSNSTDTKAETSLLEKLLKQAKRDFGVEGLVHGGLSSDFQKNHFKTICENNGLELISPLWHTSPKEYMEKLVKSNFRIIITSISAGGLDESWLGCELTSQDIEKLDQLSQKFGFNINFEGGEAESLVIDCPLFSYPINIKKSKKIWDGYRGRFEIEEAELNYSARQP